MSLINHIEKYVTEVAAKASSRLAFIGGASVIVTISMLWRLRGWGSYPFWVDEFSTAIQARYILEYGWRFYQHIWLTLEPNNLFTHLVTAGLFRVLGESEMVARIPALIAGSLVPLLVFLLAKKYMPTVIAWGAGLLTATAYIQILWSLQARGYATQQLWYVLGLVLLGHISSRWSGRGSIVLFGVLILALFTHFSSVFFIGALLISVALHTQVYRRLRAVYIIALIIVIVPILILSGLPRSIMMYLGSSFFGANNVGYYHSFLWREYGIVTFMGLSGLVLLRKKSPVICDTVILHTIFTLIFVCFLFGHHMSKYITDIFPYLYIGMAYFLYQVAQLFTSKWAQILGIGLMMLIIANGNKFATKPQKYYSINRDFREISNIDQDLLYAPIRKARESGGSPFVIDPWINRAQWYLGNGYEGIGLFYWGDEEGAVNGQAKRIAHKNNLSATEHLLLCRC
jgi:4-amino-4-deoxy-L-arabinose transferase-like glycosyltransferase